MFVGVVIVMAARLYNKGLTLRSALDDHPAVPVTAAEIAAYAEDGVVCLRGVIAPEWIARLRDGVDANVLSLTERGRFWWRDEPGDTAAGTQEPGDTAAGTGKTAYTIYDSQAWQTFPDYEAFVRESNMAELAGSLMDAASVNFFFDAIFVRSAGVQFRTPFHQDEPYWSVSGFDTCSAWMPLDPVEKRSALEFVRGSHRWTDRFEKPNFGALTEDHRDQIAYDDGAVTVPFPDVEGQREQFDILSWDMEPGDVAVFNARMIHGGSGLLRADRGLRVFNTQWVGDDARVIFRDEGMDPDHSQVMGEHGLAPGDRLSGPLYPEVWRREAAATT